MDIVLVSDEARAAVNGMLPADVAGEEPVLFCAAEEADGEKMPVGILAATLTGNSWNLSHIAVDKERRRQGVGRALVSGLIDMALGTLADEITLSYHLNPHTDNASDLFFEAMGFTEVLRSRVYAIPLKAIGEGLKTAVKKMPKGHYIPLSELPRRRWEELRRSLSAAGASYLPEPKTPAFEQPLFIDPGLRTYYDEEVSTVFLTEDGRVGGCILISPKEQGIAIDYLCSMANDKNAVKTLVGIFVMSYQKAFQKYGKDCLLFVNTQNKMSERLFLKLAAGREELYGVAVERELFLS